MLIVLATASTAVAQSPYVGLKGGVNFSNLYSGEVDDRNIRTGFHAGLLVNFPLGEVVSIQPELLYSTKGATYEYNENFFGFEVADVTADFNLNYIEVPILLNINLLDVVELHGGPYVGYLLSSSYDFDGQLIGGDINGYEDLDKDNFRSLDYGLALGLGFNLGALQLGARYNMGLANIEDSNDAEFLLGDSKNAVVQAYAALRFVND